MEECGLSLTDKDDFGSQPLHWAVLSGHLDTVQWISRYTRYVAARANWAKSFERVSAWYFERGNRTIDFWVCLSVCLFVYVPLVHGGGRERGEGGSEEDGEERVGGRKMVDRQGRQAGRRVVATTQYRARARARATSFIRLVFVFSQLII